MRHLALPTLLYAGLVGHVALRYGAGWPTAPNLLLLAGLWAGLRRPGAGTVAAAVAGLACDSIAGRPLGATMLAATLCVTVAARWRADAPAARLPARTLGLFVAVFAVEGIARQLALVSDRSQRLAELDATVRIAAATAAVYAALSLTNSTARSLTRRLTAPPAGRLPLRAELPGPVRYSRAA